MIDAAVGAASSWDLHELSPYEESFLKDTMEKRRLATGMDSPDAYRERLRNDTVEAGELRRCLQVTYSEFFRNLLAFALLEEVVLPGLLQEAANAGRKELRVWSAGCAGGEEAYSIAILLDELTAARGPGVGYRVFATDICEPEMEKARRAVYDAASIRNVRLRHLDSCFTAEGNAHAVVPRIRNQVHFSAYDMLDATSKSPSPSIYGDFNLVFCSNLLFYYRVDVRRFILEKIRQSLAVDGYLVTGEAERSIVEKIGGFRPVSPPATVFRKTWTGGDTWR